MENRLSDIIEKAAKEQGIEVVKHELIIPDPEDYKGLPWYETPEDAEVFEIIQEFYDRPWYKKAYSYIKWEIGVVLHKIADWIQE